MAATLSVPDAPLAEMNTTPLIDVLLVLLIMFIMSVPVAANITPVDLPSPDTAAARPIQAQNTLSITPVGTILWNGNAVSEATLAVTLASLVHLRPEPLVRFQPNAQAPYGTSARVLHIVKQSGIASFAFSENERYGQFTKAAPVRQTLAR
ncbi:MAG: biopolymer transporter ExbD [Proteobacteria bacterium]|nr:biopolymer transporter ExbD [Pseudomonadota bacterium]